MPRIVKWQALISPDDHYYLDLDKASSHLPSFVKKKLPKTSHQVYIPQDAYMGRRPTPPL
jgi:hypothetical protein